MSSMGRMAKPGAYLSACAIVSKLDTMRAHFFMENL
jgi:hypothetical protein